MVRPPNPDRPTSEISPIGATGVDRSERGDTRSPQRHERQHCHCNKALGQAGSKTQRRPGSAQLPLFRKMTRTSQVAPASRNARSMGLRTQVQGEETARSRPHGHCRQKTDHEIHVDVPWRHQHQCRLSYDARSSLPTHHQPGRAGHPPQPCRDHHSMVAAGHLAELLVAGTAVLDRQQEAQIHLQQC